MFKTVSEKQKICSYICALLMLFMLFALSVPYWHYTTLPADIATQDSTNLEKNFHNITVDTLAAQELEKSEKELTSITTESGKASLLAKNAMDDSSAVAGDVKKANAATQSLTTASDLAKVAAEKAALLSNAQVDLETKSEITAQAKAAMDAAETEESKAMAEVAWDEASLAESEARALITTLTEEYDAALIAAEEAKAVAAQDVAKLYTTAFKNYKYEDVQQNVNPWKTGHVSVLGYLWGCKNDVGFAKWYVETIDDSSIAKVVEENKNEIAAVTGDENLSYQEMLDLKMDINFDMLNEEHQRKVADYVADEVAVTPIWMLLLCLLGLALCWVKPRIAFFNLIPIACALLCILTYNNYVPSLYNPVFSYGLMPDVHIYLSYAMIIFAVAAIAFAVYDKVIKSSKKKVLSKGNLAARIAAIKSLGETTDLKIEDVNKNFHLLLSYLNDEIPECRIAATETLAATTREVAVTHISHKIDVETDEKVIKAMRKALVEIRENIKENA